MGRDNEEMRKPSIDRDRGNTDRSNSSGFDSTVSEVHEQAKVDHERDHNHTIKQADEEGSTLNNGRLRLSHRSSDQTRLARKKKEKDRAMLRTAMKQLLDRLEDLSRQMDEINQRLEEITSEIEELKNLKELVENGTVDPMNPDHAKLLKNYGITQEDVKSGNLLLILTEKLGYRFDEQTELEKRKERLQREAQEAIHEAQADGIITRDEAKQFDRRLKSSEEGVSAAAWDTDHASEELIGIAADNNSSRFQVAKDAGRLNLSDGGLPNLSFASTLDGEASYAKGVQSPGGDLSIRPQFAACADPNQCATELEPAIRGPKLKIT